MISPRVLLCNGAPRSQIPRAWAAEKIITLNTLGDDPNVNVRLEDVARIFSSQIPPRLVDLLEIAALIYAADTCTSRGDSWINDGEIESWGRRFFFLIPVRDLDFWRQSDIRSALTEVVQFLSNDECEFKFVPLKQRPPRQDYLDFGLGDEWPFYSPSRVLMFSGGLDSLSGAVETLECGGNAVLVSHRPVASIDSRQKRLVATLKDRFPDQIIHVPVCINKEKSLGREHTQRTRSILFGAIGVMIAEALRASGVRFFENGVVSLNLPVADEVLQARASRTTHPMSLEMLQSLFAKVLGRNFVVDNPYLFLTKTEVVQKLALSKHADLIGLSCSCAHTWFQTKTQWHCGRCSQCIDRRIAVIAAGASPYEHETDYVEDVFVGKRLDGYERNMAVDYARHGTELARLSASSMAAKFNLELTRAARPYENRRAVAEQFIQMHIRHGTVVRDVLLRKLSEHAAEILDGSLESSSLLAMVAGQQHQEPNWRRFCNRIVALLRNGLPVATQTHKPQDEPHLQEICDGILMAQDMDLVREFPFMQWSSSLTKPDWSSSANNVWVELKYVRRKYGVRRITEDIAADITKYGDQGVRVLFVVYDPEHVIANEREFSSPIIARPAMIVEIVR